MQCLKNHPQQPKKAKFVYENETLVDHDTQIVQYFIVFSKSIAKEQQAHNVNSTVCDNTIMNNIFLIQHNVE